MLLLTSSLENIKQDLATAEHVLAIATLQSMTDKDIINALAYTQARFTYKAIAGDTFITESRWRYYETVVLHSTPKDLLHLLHRLKQSDYLSRLKAIVEDPNRRLILYGSTLQIAGPTVCILGQAKHIFVNQHTASQGVDLTTSGLDLIPYPLLGSIDLEDKTALIATLRSISLRQTVLGLSSKGYYIVGASSVAQKKHQCQLSLFKDGAVHKLLYLPEYTHHDTTDSTQKKL